MKFTEDDYSLILNSLRARSVNIIEQLRKMDRMPFDDNTQSTQVKLEKEIYLIDKLTDKIYGGKNE